MLKELDQKLPSFIKDAPVFKTMDKIEKVFPKIGLPNIEEPIAAKRPSRTVDEALVQLEKISKTLETKKNTLHKAGNTYKTYSYYGSVRMKERPKEWIAEKNSLVSLLGTLVSSMKKNPRAFIKGTRHAKLVIPTKISAGRLTLNKGDLATQLTGINKKLKARIKLPLRSLERERGKAMSLFDKKIVFSSDGEKGAWDIATMSMRGISSCQRWDGSYKQCLIGSVADPFAGIIYVSGKDMTTHGSRMFYRAVVRLVVNGALKPAFFIERIYPRGLSTVDTDQARRLFEDFLRNKVGKYPVHYGNIGGLFIPNSKASQFCVDNGCHSYRDSGLGYGWVDPATLHEVLK